MILLFHILLHAYLKPTVNFQNMAVTHCSLLPKFAGLLPSFWTLYEESEYIGATVHMMDDKIDNGAILAQEKMICPKGITMFSAINLTKKMGGKIMLETITKIIDREANLTSNSQ